MEDCEHDRCEGFPAPSAEPEWLLAIEGFDELREREVESWLTVANGESGTRGSVEEGSPFSAPGVMVAGVFGEAHNAMPTRRPLPAPDWLYLRLLVANRDVSLLTAEVVEHRRLLDMRHGLLFREWCLRDSDGRVVRVRSARFASLDDRSIVALRAQAWLEHDSADLTWQGCPRLADDIDAIGETAVGTLDGSGTLVVTKAHRGGRHATAVLTVPSPGSPLTPSNGHPQRLTATITAGQLASVDRFAAIVPCGNGDEADMVQRAREAADRAHRTGWDALVSRHREAWDRCWESCAIDVEGDSAAQQAIRFALYHMLGSAHPERETVSVGARGLTGDAYHGHVFWDTEVFVAPFFIYTQPATARALLAYRHHNLDGARDKARSLGYRGALFPWESADTGNEVTPMYGIGPDGEKVPILSGIMEHHISADVAWATWEYWMATGDEQFMRDMGIELLLETARFWASRAESDADGRFHIREVIGPDEYHEGVDDNAFTNVMARWNIHRALDALDWLHRTEPDRARALCQSLQIVGEEPVTWRKVADGLVDGFQAESGLYEQFAGFFDLPCVDESLLRPRPLAADLILGREVTNHCKVVKQADVVMMCHLLPEEIDDEVARVNYEYYEPLTVHGSSLSPGIHAAVAARLGRSAEAMQAFELACSVDLGDGMGNAAGGVHLATMGSIWQATVMGFGGVRRNGVALVVDPHLPQEWSRLAFTLLFRGSRLHVAIEPSHMGITISGNPVPLTVAGRTQELGPGSYEWTRGVDQGWSSTHDRTGGS